MTPSMFELFSRFHPGGDAKTNGHIQNDPTAIEEVPLEVQEEVDYPRVPFNFPEKSLPQANYFALVAMAESVLRGNGFGREATQLMRSIKLLKHSYSETFAVLFRVLDFGPSPQLDPESQALMEKLQKTNPHLVVDTQKPPQTNPLEHKSNTVQEEWKWLVENADVQTIYGKTAACELNPKTMTSLSLLWLEQMHNGTLLDKKADDTSFGNYHWFSQKFPMGWMNLDVLHDTALISARLDLHQHLICSLFELNAKTQAGWQPSDVSRIGWAHKNTLGITGDAFYSIEAIEIFAAWMEKSLPPSSTGYSTKQKKSLPVELTSPGPLTALMEKVNPHVKGQNEIYWLWNLYSHLNPIAATMVQDAYFDDLKKDNKLTPAIKSQWEKLTLSNAINHKVNFVIPSPHADTPTITPVPLPKTLRI